MGGEFDRKPGGGSLVQNSQNNQAGGGASSPGKRTLTEQIEPAGQRSAAPTSGGAGGHSSEPAAAAPTAASTGASGAAAVPETDFVTASGNAIAKTTKKEAEVLNRIRREPRRFDPAWLATAQRNLGVVDATGAFNTETLRAMRERAHQPALDVAGIMNESFLATLAPGTPFHEGTEVGTLANRQAADARATSNKDRTAQDVGYASFAAYNEAWGTDAVSFLGERLRRTRASILACSPPCR